MPLHLPKFFALMFQFLCYVSLLLSTSGAFAFIIEAKVLQQQLANKPLYTLKNDAITHLQRFYVARDYQPVWIRPEAELSPLETALTFIANADLEGLESRDYELPLLRQLQAQSHQSPTAAIELEIRTTHAVMTLARDLARGRLTATEADPNWHIPQPTFDAVTFLQEAMITDHLQSSLEDLSSKKPSYQMLKQTLVRYQKLANDHVHWINIPDVPTLRPGDTHTVIPLIRQRILQAYAADGIAEYQVTANESMYYDDELVAAIQTFQAQHGLNTDGVIGRLTLHALNTSLDWKIRQLRINMERLRWLPRKLGERYLLVNTAGFRLTAAEHGRHMLNMRIIVGRDYRSTPSFSGTLSHMILNPYWNVPASIARKDLLPKQQRDPTFFTSSHFKVYPSHDRKAEAIDPDTIDWQAIPQGFPYVLRQDPGLDNALGRIKFMFANPFHIYLHDTPSKSLFQKDIRTFSSGCIRLEKPLELAAFTLSEQDLSENFMEKLDSGKNTTVHLPKPLPIYLVYITAWVDELEKVHFSPDIYERDLRALRYAGW